MYPTRGSKDISMKASVLAVLFVIIVVIIQQAVLAGCNSAPSEPKSNPAHHFATAHATLANYREFDLLSGPVAPGAKVATTASVSWKNYRECRMYLADAVQPYFKDSYLEDDAHGNVIGHGTNTGKVPVRFAAVVTCNTDEPGVQTGRGSAEWPELIGSGAP